MRLPRIAAAALAGLALLAVPVMAGDAQCRQALALALDVSGSVDGGEYALQRRGLAAALRHPEVAQALFAMPAAPVSLLVYEWSGPDSQRLLLDWTAIDTPATLEQIAATLAAAPRATLAPSTALGAAMQSGLAHLARRPACWSHTLDISGDGKSNTGPAPGPVRALAMAANVTINALVIGADAPAAGDARFVEIGELTAYFRAYVLAGPNAFAETALGFNDYEAAMVRKLKREVSGLVLSRR